jgi:hypothetical protein
VSEQRLYEYVGWIRDNRLAEDDQDREWPAVFIVTALSATEAQAWGDHLSAGRFSPGDPEEFSHSVVRPASDSTTPNLAEVPVIPYGYEASAAEIGW